MATSMVEGSRDYQHRALDIHEDPMDDDQEHPDPFDYYGFVVALEDVCRRRGVTWTQLADQSGVSRHAIYRLRAQQEMTLRTFGRLLAWSGLEPSMFFGATTCQRCGLDLGGTPHRNAQDCIDAQARLLAVLRRRG